MQFDQPAQNTDAEGANDIQELAPPVQTNTQPRRSGRSRNSRKRLIADSSWNTMSYEDPNAFYPVLQGKRQTPILASPVRAQRITKKYKTQLKRRLAEFEEHSLHMLDWGETMSHQEFHRTKLKNYLTLTFAPHDLKWNQEPQEYNLHQVFELSQFLVEDADPFLLAAKTAASDANNPTWNQAMNGPFAEEYWQAAEEEIKTLEGINAWEVVDPDQAENILPSTWAFKCK